MTNKPQNIEELRIARKRSEERTDHPDIVYLPSKDEIREKCLEIQKGWTDQQREDRNCYVQDPIIFGELPWCRLRVRGSSLLDI